MYDQLVQIITQIYPQDQKRGLFLTCMNGNAIIASVWVAMTDRPWVELLKKFYNLASQSPTPITTIVCDLVVEIQEVVDYGSLAAMDHKKIWLILVTSDGVQIWSLLPDTVGIQNLSQWLTYMKQKYQLQWMVGVYTITTDRKVVTSVTK